MSAQPKKKAQTKAKNSAKKAVKKAARKNPGIVIALVLVVVIIVAVAVVVYFKVPAVHDAVNNIISREASTNNGANNSGNGGNQQGGNSGNNGGNSNLVIGDGELKVHFVDIGQGDCIFIQFPDGKDMLIDCGYRDASSPAKQSMPNNILTYLQSLNTDNTITYLMLTHGDQDHVSCLDEVLDEFAVQNIYMPNIKAEVGRDSAQKANLQDQIDALPEEKLNLFTDPNTLDTLVYAKFFVKALSEPDCNIYLNMDADENTNSIVINDESSTYRLVFYCMTVAGWQENTLKNAHEKNDISPVGILEYNGKRIVFTGDSNEENEPEIASRIGYIDCDVLKVAHHGSHTSSLQVFLDAVNCEYAIFCCGAGNEYNHPRQAAIDRMSSYTALYRTDLNGNIVLTIDANGELSFAMDNENVTQEQERIGADTAKAA